MRLLFFFLDSFLFTFFSAGGYDSVMKKLQKRGVCVFITHFLGFNAVVFFLKESWTQAITIPRVCWIQRNSTTPQGAMHFFSSRHLIEIAFKKNCTNKEWYDITKRPHIVNHSYTTCNHIFFLCICFFNVISNVMIKDEMAHRRAIRLFIGCRAKSYIINSLPICYNKSSLCSQGDCLKDKKDKQTAKGVRRNVSAKMTVGEYEDAQKNNKLVRKTMHTIKSKNFNLRTVAEKKIALSALSIKRHTMACGVHTLPFGSVEIEKLKDCSTFLAPCKTYPKKRWKNGVVCLFLNHSYISVISNIHNIFDNGGYASFLIKI